MKRKTHQRCRKVLQVDGKSCFNCAPTNDERFRLQDAFDDAQSIVHRPFHFVAVEIVRPAQDNRCRSASLWPAKKKGNKEENEYIF